MAAFRAALSLALLASASAATPCTISNVFGDHMVLQRAPAKAMVFGFAAPGTTVKTTSYGGASGVAGADGVWRISLAAQPASTSNTGVALSFSCSTGEALALKDVLFGEVHICGGQSNMQFTLGCIGQQLGFDAKAEIADANNYPQIRTMTVGQKLTSFTPLQQLGATPQLPWSVAANTSIGQGNWSSTSAVCWFYAKDLYEATKIPQGIISSNWGGTIIQSWSDNATNAKCGKAGTELLGLELPAGVEAPEKFASADGYAARGGPSPNAGHGVLFNAMINPYTVGPMAVNTFTWFQGESNLGQGGTYYGCAQTAMIEMWRKYFNNPTAFFGFVELEPWKGVGTNLADFRPGQLSSLSLPNVGYATGTDIGDPTGPFTSIHPRNKKVIGKRLAAAALTLAYGTPTTYLPPTYKSATTVKTSGTTFAVTVEFDAVPTALVLVDDHCKTEAPFSVDPTECAWFTISVAIDDVLVGHRHVINLNATAAVGIGGKSVVLTATGDRPGTVVATAFGWNAWPINTIVSVEGLPLQPWTAKAVAAVEAAEL